MKGVTENCGSFVLRVTWNNQIVAMSEMQKFYAKVANDLSVLQRKMIPFEV